MKEQEECKLVIQPGYAYGASGNEANGVPPNAVVTYWVTLNSFIKVNTECNALEKCISLGKVFL